MTDVIKSVLGLVVNKARSATASHLSDGDLTDERFREAIFYLAIATGAGLPQQREPITVGPYYLSHPVNFPCGRKPEYPEKTHDFRQSVDYFHMRTGFKSTLLGNELGTLEVKGEWSDHHTTEAKGY